MDEAFYKDHSLDRIKQRIAVFSDEDISPKEKERIFDNLTLLGDINLNPKKSFGVLIGTLIPNKFSDYFVDVNGRGYYTIIDDKVIKDSTGNQVWAIVRGNDVTTVMLRKEVQTADDEKNKFSLDVDDIIKNLPSYIQKMTKQASVTPKEKFRKIRLNNGNIIRYYEDQNRFETVNGEVIDSYEIFEELPEDIQDKVLELSESLRRKFKR